MSINRSRSSEASLAEEWDRQANRWIRWARTPGHDSYWRFHRDQFMEIVPPPGGLTLDVGCGEGRLSRHLRSLGHTVVGVDASPAMVESARAADAEIEVHVADAAHLPLDDGVADLAIYFMSLQDIDDYEGAISEAARVLQPGGCICLAVVHPLNSSGNFRGDADDSPFVIEGCYLSVFRYQDVIERDGLSMTFFSEHRPIEHYVGALNRAGFLIDRLREPQVPAEPDQAARTMRWARIPLFLHIRAVLSPGVAQTDPEA